MQADFVNFVGLRDGHHSVLSLSWSGNPPIEEVYIQSICSLSMLTVLAVGSLLPVATLAAGVRGEKALLPIEMPICQ